MLYMQKDINDLKMRSCEYLSFLCKHVKISGNEAQFDPLQGVMYCPSNTGSVFLGSIPRQYVI